LYVFLGILEFKGEANGSQHVPPTLTLLELLLIMICSSFKKLPKIFVKEILTIGTSREVVTCMVLAFFSPVYSSLLRPNLYFACNTSSN
jgi:hypothetical protein